jgi:hypothetical protein
MPALNFSAPQSHEGGSRESSGVWLREWPRDSLYLVEGGSMRISGLKGMRIDCCIASGGFPLEVVLLLCQGEKTAATE